MIILNAPKFFSFSWGLIKKFIDPRTASRIQVFSSDSKGTLALQKLIDTDQIPLDYGGTNKSIKEAFMEESADPTLRRQEIELVHVKKNSNKSTKKAWELEKGEYMTITAYTRSASAGALTVKLNRAEYKTVPVKCVFEARQQQGGEEEPMPKCTVVVSKLLGPGKVTIEIKDLDDAPKKHQGQSRGYFLVVGDIKADDS